MRFKKGCQSIERQGHLLQKPKEQVSLRIFNVNQPKRRKSGSQCQERVNHWGRQRNSQAQKMEVVAMPQAVSLANLQRFQYLRVVLIFHRVMLATTS